MASALPSLGPSTPPSCQGASSNSGNLVKNKMDAPCLASGERGPPVPPLTGYANTVARPLLWTFVDLESGLRICVIHSQVFCIGWHFWLALLPQPLSLYACAE